MGHSSGTTRNHRWSTRRSAPLLVLAVIVFAVSMVILSGCKYSSVLTDRFEDKVLGTLDESVDPNYEPNPSSDVILDLAALSIDNSEELNTQVEALPHYDPDAPDNGPTPQRVKRQDTPHDEEATESSEPDQSGNREGEGTGEGTAGQNTDGGLSNGESEGNSEGPNQNHSDESNERLDDDDESGHGGDQVIADPGDGTKVETAKGTVAAVGEYATIAQMLGGAGALVACDADWLAARQADGCFSGELDKVAAAFSGDGSAEGSCDIEALVNTVKPSVVLYDGHVPALTADDRSKLEAAGITVQAVPTIGKQTTEDYAVTQAVLQVGEILKSAQPSAPSMAADYVSIHDSVLKAAYDNNKDAGGNGGHYSFKHNDLRYEALYQDTPLAGLDASTTARVSTAYIDDWMSLSISKATISQHSDAPESGDIVSLPHDGASLDVSDGIGVSASGGSNSYMLIDYYLQLAGVVNNAYDTDKPSAAGLAYPVMPGESTNIENALKGKTTTRRRASALFYSAGASNVTANWVAVGGDPNHDSSAFPGVLVKSADIQKSIGASAKKSNGLYRMSGSYRVVVVPTGIAGSWSEGHVDSFLMSLWAYNLRGGDENLNSVAELAGQFYKKFMRCDDWKNDGDTGGKAVKNWNNAIDTAAG